MNQVRLGNISAVRLLLLRLLCPPPSPSQQQQRRDHLRIIYTTPFLFHVHVVE